MYKVLPVSRAVCSESTVGSLFDLWQELNFSYCYAKQEDNMFSLLHTSFFFAP